MQRRFLALSGVAFLALSLVIARLGAQERGGPIHLSFEIEVEAPSAPRSGVPATLYLPYPRADADRDASLPLDPPPPSARPPAVVLVHGFAGDRRMMSTLARALAEAGYAVLAVDVAGHGENRNSFALARGGDAHFGAELAAAVDWLRRSPYVDGSRIAMAGHSMGATATLVYASRDPSIDAAVMIASGNHLPGPHRPANTLFLFGTNEVARAKLRMTTLAARLAGVDVADPEKRYGRFEHANAVKYSVVPKVGHIAILTSPEAASRVVAWLDSTWGSERSAPFVPRDGRLTTAGVGLLLLLLVLPGVGLVAGRLAPQREATVPRPALHLVWLGALVVACMGAATGAPLRIIGLEVGDLATAILGAAGVIALAAAALAGWVDLRALVAHWPRAIAAGGAASLALAWLLKPFGVVFHTLDLTPERSFAWLCCVVALTPFGLAHSALLRRGSLLQATASAAVGRIAMVAVLFAATSLGVLPGVFLLMLGTLIGLQLMIEVLSSALYASGASPLAIGLVDTLTFAWVLSAVLPMR